MYKEAKLYKYNIEEYFNQQKGNNFLGEEERNIANGILEELNKTCKICSVSKVFRPSELRMGDGKLMLGEEKIHAKLFEQDHFHDIMSILVFLITIKESEDSFIDEQKKKQKLDLLNQYYETSWKYAALQGYRDHMIEEYKVKEIQLGKGMFTPILGPGYFGIELSESEKFYELLNGKKLGITLNDKLQFIPDNTICGLVINMGSISPCCEQMLSNPCQYCLAVKKSCGYCRHDKEFSK